MFYAMITSKVINAKAVLGNVYCDLLVRTGYGVSGLGWPLGATPQYMFTARGLSSEDALKAEQSGRRGRQQSRLVRCLTPCWWTRPRLGLEDR